MTLAGTVVVLLGMFAGGLAGGSVGFGVVLVAAPIVALAAPHLLPSVVVAPSMAANGLVALRERRHRDAPLLARLVVWQLPGMAAGLWLLVQIGGDDRLLALVVALVVLALVLVGLSPWRPRRTRRTEAVAAMTAGVAGALSGTNGPPLAVLMAHDPPGLLRATLPAYFVIAQVLLLVGWGATGHLTGEAMATGLLAVPASLAGAWVGQRVLATRLTPVMVRASVLVLAVGAAVRAVLTT